MSNTPSKFYDFFKLSRQVQTTKSKLFGACESSPCSRISAVYKVV